MGNEFSFQSLNGQQQQQQQQQYGPPPVTRQDLSALESRLAALEATVAQKTQENAALQAELVSKTLANTTLEANTELAKLRDLLLNLSAAQDLAAQAQDKVGEALDKASDGLPAIMELPKNTPLLIEKPSAEFAEGRLVCSLSINRPGRGVTEISPYRDTVNTRLTFAVLVFPGDTIKLLSSEDDFSCYVYTLPNSS